MIYLIVDEDNIIYCVYYDIILALHELIELLKNGNKKYKFIKMKRRDFE